MDLFSEYLKKGHILARMDARVKLLVSIVMLGMVLTYKGFIFPIFIAVLCLSLWVWMRIPFKVFLLRFSEPLFIAGILLLLKLFFSGRELPISISLSGLKISGYKDGLLEGLILAIRIIAAVSIVNVIAASTPFVEFVAALSWMRIPCGFIEILVFAYRYIFVLIEDAMIIYNAQKNRLGYSSITRGLGSFGTLSGSLILKAFEHSSKITISMIQRGYDGNIPLLKNKPLKPMEIILSMLFVSGAVLIWRM